MRYCGVSSVLYLRHGKKICENCADEIKQYFYEKFEDEAYDYYYSSWDDTTNANPEKSITEKKAKTTFAAKNVQKNVKPKEIYNNITKSIIGQDKQVKHVLATILKNHIAPKSELKSNMFLIGGTGNGKSATAQRILKELDIPYVLEDMSKYTQEGYEGASVSTIINNLILTANGDITRAQNGVIILDEMDKKLSNGDGAGVSSLNVQDSLLKMLEGVTLSTAYGLFDARNVTFILIGACESTFKEREKRLTGKSVIGFKTDEDKLKDSELKNPNFIPQDLINSGFKSELIGRIDIIEEFNPMTIEMAKNIINHSKESVFQKYLEIFRILNVDVEMNRDEIVEEIAKRAIQLKTGVRGIKQTVTEMFKEIYSDITIDESTDKDKLVCKITKDLVKDNTKYELCKKYQEN